MNNSEICSGVACSRLAIVGKIGSTRPMPMNEMTHAKATAHTDLG